MGLRLTVAMLFLMSILTWRFFNEAGYIWLGFVLGQISYAEHWVFSPNTTKK